MCIRLDAGGSVLYVSTDVSVCVYVCVELYLIVFVCMPDWMQVDLYVSVQVCVCMHAFMWTVLCVFVSVILCSGWLGPQSCCDSHLLAVTDLQSKCWRTACDRAHLCVCSCSVQVAVTDIFKWALFSLLC